MRLFFRPSRKTTKVFQNYGNNNPVVTARRSNGTPFPYRQFTPGRVPPIPPVTQGPDQIITGTFIYSFDFTSGQAPTTLTVADLPIINTNGSFTSLNFTTFFDSTTCTVTVNYEYAVYNANLTDDGLSFRDTYSFYNAIPGFTTITISDFGNIPLSRNSTGNGQFYGPSFINGFPNTPGLNGINFIGIATTQPPTILPNTSLYGCFAYVDNSNFNFNIDLSYWNNNSAFKNVINTAYMFAFPVLDGAGSSFYNNGGSQLNWQTDNVTDMTAMFYGCAMFDQFIDTSGIYWNTSKVTSMYTMFSACILFNNGNGNNPLNLYTDNVVDMNYMFID